MHVRRLETQTALEQAVVLKDGNNVLFPRPNRNATINHD
jgi:hypothetical protein